MNKSYGSVNNWVIHLSSGSIIHSVTGESKRLGEYQLKLLSILMQEAGRPISREELSNLVWERRVIGNNSLPNAIHALRVALEDDGKNQKIIKTIPKKGYLLEAEYCSFIEQDEANSTPNDTGPEEPPPSSDEEVDAPPPAETLPMISLPMEQAAVPSPSSYFQRCTIFALILLLAILCCTILAGMQGKRHLNVQEIQTNIYSNISLQAIGQTHNLSGEQSNLYNKLKGTFYDLNQQLITQAVMMHVYFFSANQTLNYTFTLSSPCDSKQLVMTINYWRIDPLRLNNLILRETRRKINEMAVCKQS